MTVYLVLVLSGWALGFLVGELDGFERGRKDADRELTRRTGADTEGWERAKKEVDSLIRKHRGE